MQDNRPIPGFAIPKDQILQDSARSLNQLMALLSGDKAALDASNQTQEDPLVVWPLTLDDNNATLTTDSIPRIVEISVPHKTLYFQESNSLSAYFYYRPVSKSNEFLARWIKVKKGDVINWPFPVAKAYVYYPVQPLLTANLLFLRYGNITTATVNTISLNAGSGSSVVTNPFTATGDQTTVAVAAAAAATPLLPALSTRTRAWIYNDAGGDTLWVGDSNTTANRGIPIAPGERLEWTNVGPLYGYSAGGTNVYGAEERQ